MNDDNLPPGAANDPNAPWNQTEDEVLCEYCKEPAPDGIDVGDWFECPDCQEEGQGISKEEYEGDQWASHQEDLADRMRDDGW